MPLVLGFFFEPGFKRQKIDFGPSDVFTNLWRIKDNPAVLRLSFVLLFALICLNAFFFFIDTYLYVRFQFNTQQNAIALIIFGGAMALGSGVLTAPLHKRFGKINILYATIAIMGVGILAFILNSVGNLSYLLIIPITIAFGIMYPTMLSLFSAGAGPSEQGWSMGVTVAIYALGSGIITAVGGSLMDINERMPFLLGIGSCIAALILMAATFRNPAIRKLDSIHGHPEGGR